MKRILLATLALCLAACDATTETPPDRDLDPGATLAAVRIATEVYHDIDRARADGYAVASPCVASSGGGMDVHYMKNDLLDGTIDPAAPEMLLFEPQANGSFELVGVEFMVPSADWNGSSAPRLNGVVFASHLRAEEQHGIPFPHYDLHVWAWRDNPSGTYAPFNPDVSCDHAG